MSETKLTLTQECLDSYEEDARESNMVEVSSLVLLSLIAAARELEARWIPVTERLPDGGRVVLAFDATTSGAMLVWRDRDSPVWFPALGLARPMAADITHWMPLPKGPTK